MSSGVTRTLLSVNTRSKTSRQTQGKDTENNSSSIKANKVSSKNKERAATKGELLDFDGTTGRDETAPTTSNEGPDIKNKPETEPKRPLLLKRKPQQQTYDRQRREPIRVKK